MSAVRAATDNFDGPGRALARAQVGKAVTFDAEERWILQSQHLTSHQPATPGEFCLLPVAMHEIGHVLGMQHSSRPFDIMAPYYRADARRLSINDVSQCTKLYPQEAS